MSIYSYWMAFILAPFLLELQQISNRRLILVAGKGELWLVEAVIQIVFSSDIR